MGVDRPDRTAGDMEAESLAALAGPLAREAGSSPGR